MAFTSIAVHSRLLHLIGVLYVSLFAGYALAADAPDNIRLEQNRMVWDDVDGVSTFDIYLLSSAGLNANGTYLTTVVDANEFALSTAGVYTVVSASPNGEYSPLHSGGRVRFDNTDNSSSSGTTHDIGNIDPPENIRIEQNLLVWDDVPGVTAYDIYFLSSDHPNANGTYFNTVVNANEYALNRQGVYTVVSAAPDGQYSALHSGGRVNYDFTINVGAVDAPENIRLEDNRLVWDDVPGVSTFDIYLMSSFHRNANATYLVTVVDGNEYTLSTAGIYTVVSAAPDFAYSAVHSGGRVEFGN